MKDLLIIIKFNEEIKVDDLTLENIISFTKKPNRIVILLDCFNKINIPWTSLETESTKNYSGLLASKIDVYQWKIKHKKED